MIATGSFKLSQPPEQLEVGVIHQSVPCLMQFYTLFIVIFMSFSIKYICCFLVEFEDFRLNLVILWSKFVIFVQIWLFLIEFHHF